MKAEKGHHPKTGRFLSGRDAHPIRPRGWLMIAILFTWDGVLLYMIVECLIAPVYGAAFVAVISLYLGYQL